MPEPEYGIRWRWRDGSEFVRGGYTLRGAKVMMAGARPASRKCDPVPLEIVLREVSDWESLIEPQ